MKTLLGFMLLLVLATSCSEQGISPENTVTRLVEEDPDQPPKGNCSGRPNCHP
ncbi:hypothetical protein [Dyadobacter helix]|uniref:hypothetical protein n=1 Tax=Dyadobacter helix TaxID=2822344 RepID=UPI001BFCAB51|nr:hypothetical protein [Dyadobacter sp. CECT 9275]